MPGQLRDDHVLVSSAGEASRLINKGQFGKPLSGGGLRLDLYEAAYLAEAERLDVVGPDGPVPSSELFVRVAALHPGFEVPYLVYRDFRERGFVIRAAPKDAASAGAHFVHWARGVQRLKEPVAWLRAESERAPFALASMARFVAGASAAGCAARLAIVDEESDLTHYELDATPPSGPLKPPAGGRASEATLVTDRVVVHGVDRAGFYPTEFYGKPVDRNLHLSLVEAGHLLDRGDLRLKDARTGRAVSVAALRKLGRELEPDFDLRSRVYGDLRSRGLIVKTGYKFGTHFRAYEEQPDEAHAPYLVQAVRHDHTSGWEPLARAIRLSHTVRKKFFLASVGPEGISYLAFGRFRP